MMSAPLAAALRRAAMERPVLLRIDLAASRQHLLACRNAHPLLAARFSSSPNSRTPKPPPPPSKKPKQTPQYGKRQIKPEFRSQMPSEIVPGMLSRLLKMPSEEDLALFIQVMQKNTSPEQAKVIENALRAMSAEEGGLFARAKAFKESTKMFMTMDREELRRTLVEFDALRQTKAQNQSPENEPEHNSQTIPERSGSNKLGQFTSRHSTEESLLFIQVIEKHLAEKRSKSKDAYNVEDDYYKQVNIDTLFEDSEKDQIIQEFQRLQQSRTEAKSSQNSVESGTPPEPSEPQKPKSQLSPEEIAKINKLLDSFAAQAPETLKASAEKAVKILRDSGSSLDKSFLEALSAFGNEKHEIEPHKFAAAYMMLTLRSDQLEQAASEAEISSSFVPPQAKPKEKPKDSKATEYEFKIDNGTIIITALLLYMVYSSIAGGDSRKQITWQEFRTAFLDKGLVEKLEVVNNNTVKVELNRSATGQIYPDSPVQNPRFGYAFSIGSVEAFERKLDEAQKELGIPAHERIPVSYKEEGSWANLIYNFGPTLLFIGVLIFFSRRAGAAGGGQSGIFGFGKSRAKMFNQEADIKVRFKDVAGMDEAKQEIMEFVSFLKDPSRFQRLGAKIPRGAILSGPPGTGKTLIAKATAGEAQVPFFSVSGSEFVEMFVGVGPSRVRDLFARARKNTPCIIFIDEIDAIGKARGKNTMGGDNERESTLNQLLTEMDGFNTSEQVVVLAGTNRPDVLDKALMRPGRFDRHIALDRPTMEGRRQIFLVHLNNVVTEKDTEKLASRLAALTPGFSGADISNCVNEGALIAARSKADEVKLIHFEQAIERVIGGLEKKSLVLSPEEKKTVAYHEAGHAVCGWFFKYADPLLKVSIIPRGQGALGYAQYLPQGDTYLMNVSQLMDRMAMTLGGRVSEELHFETVTSGASDDFNKVTRMATAMVTKWGMSSKLGYIFYDEESNQFQKPFSESTAQTIDSEVRRIVDEAYKQCRALLEEKKKEVGLVAEELLAKEVLGRDDMVRLLGKRPFEENKEFAKFFGSDGSRLPGITEAPPPFPQELQPEGQQTGTLGYKKEALKSA